MENNNRENRFMHTGNKKPDGEKAGRILYIVIIAVLCVSAIIVGIVSAAHRNRNPVDTSESDSSQTPETPDNGQKPNTPQPPEDQPGTEDTAKIPEMIVPVTGSLAKPHDESLPVYSQTMGDFRTHTGVDIAAAVGDSVLSVANGTVKEIYEDPFMGTSVAVAMNGDTVAIYKNLGSVADGLTVGTTVAAGDAIGTVGESAMIEIADEPHLHFELTVGGSAVDPMDYFSEESIEVSLGGDKVTEE